MFAHWDQTGVSMQYSVVAMRTSQNVATVVAWAQLGKLYWYSLSTDVVVVLCEEGEAPLAQLVSVVDLTGLQDPGQEFTKN